MTAPSPVEELLPRARELTSDPRTIPDRNAIMRELRVGAPKANEIRARLAAEVEQRRVDGRRHFRRLAQKARQTLPAYLRRPRSAADLPIPVSPTVEAQPVIGSAQPNPVANPVAPQPLAQVLARSEARPKRVVTWPALIVAAPAAVAIWAGWVAIGRMTGFGPVDLLPGIGTGFVVDTAITLPIGVEAYAAYAFYVALHPSAPHRARRFGGWSALLAVLLGMGGQTAYHLMAAAGMQLAPWQITTVVSCLPVALFGAVAALVHMVRAGEQ